MSLSRLNHTALGTRCLRFAGRVTPPPRKTRFRLLARLSRAGLVNPQGSDERFLSSRLFLLSQASCAMSVHITIEQFKTTPSYPTGRVGPGRNRAGSPWAIAPRGSHRSGLARLRHPARHVTQALRGGTPSGPRSLAEADDASGSD